MNNNSEFKILGVISKAYESEGKLFVAGLASGIEIDREGERMATTAIQAFQRSVDDGIFHYDGTWTYIPLRSGHRGEWDDVLGWIVECSVDSQWNFHIVAELDQDNPQAINLYKKLTRPSESGKSLRLGFSIGGMVIAAGEEWDDELGRFVFVYRDVALRETSVTSMPAYAPSYVTALFKSVDWDKVKGHRHVELVSEADRARLDKEQAMEKSDNTPNTEAEETVAEAVEKAEEVSEETVAEEVAEEVVEESAEEVAEETVEESVDSEESEEVVEEAAEVEETDPLADIRDVVANVAASVQELATAVSTIQEQVGKMTGAQASDEEVTKDDAEQVSTDATEKSAEAATEAEEGDSVEKTAETEEVVDVVKAIADAVAAAVAPLQARIDELEAQPVDKSYAVTKDGEEEELNPVVKFRKEAEENNLTGSAAIAAALSHLR